MARIELHLNGDGCWPDLVGLDEVGNAYYTTKPLELAVLKGGMNSGAPSVTVRVNLESGAAVLVETSLKLLVLAVRAMVEAHGDPTEK